jgi:hypothetical protein
MITHTQQLIISSTKLNKKIKDNNLNANTRHPYHMIKFAWHVWSKVQLCKNLSINNNNNSHGNKGITQTKTLNHVQRKLVIRMQWPPKRCHHCSSHCIWTPIVSALVFDIPGMIPGVNPYTRPSLDGVLQKSCHFVVYFKLRLLPGFFLCIWYVYCTRQPSIPDLLWYIRSVSSIQIHVQHTYAPGELGGTTEHGNRK